MVGATPIFVDCRPGSVNLDTDLIEGKISAKTKAIMPVHAFGLPVDLDPLMSIAEKNRLSIIEDAACALGSRCHGRQCGTLGNAGIFSFHPRKLLTTGEGGAVVTADRKIAERVRSLSNHGFEDSAYRSVGFNYRMTDFQAAMGLKQLGDYRHTLVRRRAMAKRYWRKLTAVAWAAPILPDERVVWNVQTLIIFLHKRISRDDLILHLHHQGIESTIGTYCVPAIPYYRNKYGYAEMDFPHASHSYRQLLSLPLHDDLTDDDMDRVVSGLQSFTSR
jgi:dTDP-4-amino-4,6-dideoxygalactose transaminase